MSTALCCAGLFYGGARLGTYSPIKRALGGDEEHISLLRNLVAGSVTGGFAAAVTNPLDLVKTRLQSKVNPHKTIGQVVSAVLKDEGVVGLWAGTMPSVVSSFLASFGASLYHETILNCVYVLKSVDFSTLDGGSSTLQRRFRQKSFMQHLFLCSYACLPSRANCASHEISW